MLGIYRDFRAIPLQFVSLDSGNRKRLSELRRSRSIPSISARRARRARWVTVQCRTGWLFDVAESISVSKRVASLRAG